MLDGQNMGVDRQSFCSCLSAPEGFEGADISPAHMGEESVQLLQHASAWSGRWFLAGLGFQLMLHRGNFGPFVLDVEPQSAEKTHVQVRHPDQRKSRDDISSPPRVYHGEMRRDQHEDSHVVTEAIFAGEKVEKLSFRQ